jgi:hypothetical protein
MRESSSRLVGWDKQKFPNLTKPNLKINTKETNRLPNTSDLAKTHSLPTLHIISM